MKHGYFYALGIGALALAEGDLELAGVGQLALSLQNVLKPDENH